MRRALALGMILGAFIGFIDSYGYAVSGFTTAEIAVVIVPLLLLALSKALRVSLSKEEFIVAAAIAIGFDITTTLTSGMYITYGFLDYVSDRLKEFGLEVKVPELLYAWSTGIVIDVKAMPTYIALSMVSLSGAFIAYAFRLHYISRERLMYPLSVAASMIVKCIRRIPKSYLIAILLGFLLQMLAFQYELFIDFTPVTSSLLPGAIFGVSFIPIIIGLMMLLPLGSLKSISIGSIATYLIILPLSIAVSGISALPMMTYEDALFAYSNIVVSLLVGIIVVSMLYYVLVYRKIFIQSFRIALSLTPERASLFCGLALLLFLVPIALALSYGALYNIARFAILVLGILVLHFLLTLVNLRVVGESGIGSQAILPIATFYMYSLGIRDVGLYAALDPFTGIPMPQVVGGTAMNMIRFSRFNGVRSSKVLLGLSIGSIVGSFITYFYGNLLVAVYGYDSPQMPLVRWIPTLVWMATVYTGKLETINISVLIIGILIGILLIISNTLYGIAIFPFIIGVTMPPDIGFVAMLCYAIKSALVKLGVEVHEKSLIFSVLFLVGCGIAIAMNTIACIPFT